MKNQKIKQDEIRIGQNIREIRLKKKIGQTELVRRLQLSNIEMTREALVKIERGIQHINAKQLRGIFLTYHITKAGQHIISLFLSLSIILCYQKNAIINPTQESGPTKVVGATCRAFVRKRSGDGT